MCDECDECLPSHKDVWCYSDGDKHYCDRCWEKLKKK